MRALALAVGLIPPRPMISSAEAAVLERLATGARRVVELGVYEGSSAVVLCRALNADAELHLVDPFLDGGSALRQGWRANPTATRWAVRRAKLRHGPAIHWHLEPSQELGRTWTGGEADLVFIDGDHSPAGCRKDWDMWHPHVRAGGAVAFHDARASQSDGVGHPGPTGVVDELFRRANAEHGDWAIIDEVDALVVVRRR
jgi:predicted O-methyltransferase YrrM